MVSWYDPRSLVRFHEEVLDATAVLEAICAVFVRGSEPPSCRSTDIEYCNYVFEGCLCEDTDDVEVGVLFWHFEKVWF